MVSPTQGHSRVESREKRVRNNFNQFRENRNIPIGRYGGFSQKPKGENSGRISNESLEQTATGKMERFWT